MNQEFESHHEPQQFFSQPPYGSQNAYNTPKQPKKWGFGFAATALCFSLLGSALGAGSV